MRFLIFRLLFYSFYNSGNLNDTPEDTLQVSTGVETEPISNDICITPACQEAATQIKKDMDPTVSPCDDFYQFACGRFLKTTLMPKDEIIVDKFHQVVKELEPKLRNVIGDQIKDNEPKAFVVAKNFYQACMNTATINAKGISPAIETLKQLGGWPVIEDENWLDEDFEWKESVYKFRKLGFPINYFFHFDVVVDSKNNTKRVIEIDQAYLGLSREYLIKGFSDKIVSAYYSYMVDIAVMLGANRTGAETELKKSLEFEMKLANISLPQEERRNHTALYNPMTVKELNGNYTSIPWKKYINKMLKSNVEVGEDELVTVNVPSYLKEFEKLIKQIPKRVQANYIMWRAASEMINYLSDDIRRRELKYLTEVTGKAERKARWKECSDHKDLIYGTLGLSVGALYVRKYFTENSKKSAVEMITDIRQEFKKILKQVEWMDEKTRQSALEKADAMGTNIAYPDELLDDKKLEEFYENLEINPDDYLQAILNLTLFETEYTFGQLRKPVNKSDWITHGRAAIVNAYYSPFQNSIQLPAGILQAAFFNNERPRYMNYGAIGFFIGHEITHGFDDRGRQFDKDGNLVDWWEPETKTKYFEKAKCIIEQYGNYTAKEVGLKLNGVITQGENIADNGGAKESYLAYQESVKRNGIDPKLPGLDYTPSQLFWISAAQAWCSKYRPEILKKIIITDVHSPSEFRVRGPFSNRPEFSKDFKCSAGTMMNPENKCSVW